MQKENQKEQRILFPRWNRMLPPFTHRLPQSDFTVPRLPLPPLAPCPHKLFQCALWNSFYHKQAPAVRLTLLMSTTPVTWSSVLPSVNLQVTLPHSLRTFAPGPLSVFPAPLLGDLSSCRRLSNTLGAGLFGSQV